MDLEKNTPKELIRLNEQLTSIKPGENLLLKIGKSYSLMKYEKSDTEIEDCNTHRFNRHTCIGTSNWLFADTDEKRKKLAEEEQREWKRHKGNIYATHCIDFMFDQEFQLFLPQSSGCDKFLTLARETRDGEIVLKENDIDMFVGDDLIIETLQGILRPQYFEKIIIPFMEGRCPNFSVPKWKKRLFRQINRSSIFELFEKATQNLEHGAFVYVGCKEEVYILGLARNEKGMLYMQGTYTTSTKPPLYFSNNYLEFISRYDAEKPKFEGEGGCNVARYRTYDIPGFHGQPFIFPQIGRSQDCKNTIFTGEPELITGDIDEALVHFASTDFAEFADVVREYANQINSIHPSSGEPNGRFYY